MDAAVAVEEVRLARRAAKAARGRGGNTPPEYRTGIGAEGVTAIREFVQKGGTLVTLNAATAFAVDRLGIGVRNVLDGKEHQGILVPRLHAEGHVRQYESAGIRNAVARAGALPEQSGV